MRKKQYKVFLLNNMFKTFYNNNFKTIRENAVFIKFQVFEIKISIFRYSRRNLFNHCTKLQKCKVSTLAYTNLKFLNKHQLH